MIGRQDFFFFVPAFLLSILTRLFLPSSVSLSYFILAVPMRECLGQHSCMSSTFPIAILNGTCFFPTVLLQVREKNKLWDGDTSQGTSNPVWTKLKQTAHHGGSNSTMVYALYERIIWKNFTFFARGYSQWHYIHYHCPPLQCMSRVLYALRCSVCLVYCMHSVAVHVSCVACMNSVTVYVSCITCTPLQCMSRVLHALRCGACLVCCMHSVAVHVWLLHALRCSACRVCCMHSVAVHNSCVACTPLQCMTRVLHALRCSACLVCCMHFVAVHVSCVACTPLQCMSRVLHAPLCSLLPSPLGAAHQYSLAIVISVVYSTPVLSGHRQVRSVQHTSTIWPSSGP